MKDYIFSPFPKLLTDRLVLRQMNSDDIHEIFALRSDKLVSELINRPIAKDVKEALDYIQMINEGISRNDWVLWAITLHDSNQLIGTICLWNFSTELEKGEVGYELSPTFQGKGIMQEALSAVLNYGFENLKLLAIEGIVSSNNLNSIRILEKNYFKNTGFIKEEENRTSSIVFSLSNNFYKKNKL
ncbi:GNAT family N-acetyltransferase [Bacillus sp. EAC]|uniref:GNAT family N-acetyltransferase n=1 Tax=Bacillus sp. EAC TaxID=1978338 RepID=UPI000B442105|nr:GNAT family N-acetyltransferase [Bacillus sp. EAC]